ncbi:glycerol-3-phosphate acyltransferase [Geobacter sp. OR-1]|uniref:glycerol-3-phosphate 1-O-acyltransferase PlsY n=1 Tax=Geobacter sp. OR-1 TaxID=1266765 RepID=UPI0005421336|nr:glycerol-3-phosphate 1-O-acyltransferase PlsY [Geobacter sp. OR-1]GAM10138.1 glycerol-3-phosphate acyltransferase [Geobacter sp. OR-1]
MTPELLLVIAAYLAGSIPTGLLLARLMGGVDIRTTGSGNIGATNVSRTLGWKVGVLTLLGDCLKGVVPVLVARGMGFSEGWLALTAFAAFIGHVYTIFLRFKGGKGVATALGVFLALSPLSVAGAVAIFALMLWKWRYVSLGSITAAVAMPLLVAFIDRRGLIFLVTIAIAAIVVWKHRENIQRLRNGTESKFKG